MDYLSDLIARYPTLSVCKDEISATYDALKVCFDSGKRLYVCGNGGSAADALHIVGELVKSFIVNRPLDLEFSTIVDDDLVSNLHGALPVFSLAENLAFTTAFINDCNPEYVFAQQVYAYAQKGDSVLGISTSGNSRNVINGLRAAKGRGAVTLGLTGGTGGKMKTICDYLIVVPENETYKIQELHLPVYHALCLMLEMNYWGK